MHSWTLVSAIFDSVRLHSHRYKGEYHSSMWKYVASNLSCLSILTQHPTPPPMQLGSTPLLFSSMSPLRLFSDVFPHMKEQNWTIWPSQQQQLNAHFRTQYALTGNEKSIRSVCVCMFVCALLKTALRFTANFRREINATEKWSERVWIQASTRCRKVWRATINNDKMWENGTKFCQFAWSSLSPEHRGSKITSRAVCFHAKSAKFS